MNEQQPAAYLEFLHLFGAARYFEAHDVLEEPRLAACGPANARWQVRTDWQGRTDRVKEGTYSVSPGTGGVHWQEWGPAAFARAEHEKKPVLLHIGAVWCHWCHVMDKTTYGNPQVVNLVNERFVPVRVDNDRRPDVNRRYNMGGWPTTAFLSPTGRVLTGATYVPPQQMLRLSETVLDFWQGKQAELSEDAFAGAQSPEREGEDDLDRTLLYRLAAAVERDFDPQYGGFGRQPKFPQAASLQLALDRWLRTGEDRYREVVDKTLSGMAGGGMYDPVEGGFFRYSTTRDWSVPHFEKMLEDNARLLDLYVRAYVATGEPAYRATAADVLRFWQTVLRNPGTPFLAGSQDADEEYYGLSLGERRGRSSPFIDRTVYADWNALAVRALLRAGAVLQEPEYTAWGVELAGALDHDLRVAGEDRAAGAVAGGMAHFRPLNGAAALPGLLSDQAEMMRALLAVYAVTHEAWAFQRAVELAGYLEEHLAAPGGGYFDRAADPAALGALKLRITPMEENVAAALALLELHQLTGRPEYEERARRTLAAHSGGLDRYGSHAAVFGLGLDTLLDPLHVAVVGPAAGTGAAETQALLGAARRVPLTGVSFSVQDTAGENPHGPASTYPAGPHSQAYVCAGTTCFAPVGSPQALAELLASVGRQQGRT
ncbi:MAG: DUF255 domain-containing protein [Symbiobacteriia bacterium]